MFGYGSNNSYSYSYGTNATNTNLTQQALNLYNTSATNGFNNPASNYGYGTATASTQPKQSAENPYGYGNARMPNNIPVGFTSAGTLSSTQAALGSLYNQQQSATAAAVNALSNSVSAGTHYEGYDAAVLAVTTDYINKNKANWVNHGNLINPQGTFPSKKRPGFGRRQPPKDPKAYFCETCKISCAGPQAFKEHLAGKNHKKKEAIQNGENKINLPKNKITFRCEVCDLTCTGKDTYDAHVRGARHKKAASLLKKLGKELPAEPTIIAPTKPADGEAKTKVIGVTGTNFVAGQNLTTTGTEEENEVIKAALEAENQIQPIGEEYIDTNYDTKGKVVEYRCRLCECSFSDPNAKAVHTKGRRHRLAYRNKVDPTIRVEMKNSVINARHKREKKAKEQSKNFFNPPAAPIPLHQWFDADNSAYGSHHESNEDRHIIAKYEEIKMDAATLESVTRLVEMIEKALKSTSDIMKATDFQGDKKPDKDAGEINENEQKTDDERVLKGLMKVGLYANGLMMKSDTNIDLVVLCSKIPTKTSLEVVVSLLIEHFDPTFKDKIDVQTNHDKTCFVVKAQGISVSVTVTLTCTTIREYEGKLNDSDKLTTLPEEHLPLNPSLDALAELRRAKWYQAKANPIEGINIVLTVLRDIRERVVTWQPLTDYMLALFTQNVLESFGYPMSPGDALRRVFEALSSAILLNRRAILMDPCEKDKNDLMEILGRQEREDITSSAQHALRLIIFDQIEKILDMDRLPNSTQRKRAADNITGKIMNPFESIILNPFVKNIRY